MNNNTTKSELRIDEGGRWVVRSAGTTVCLLDLDRRLLKRRRVAGSQAFPFDGLWVSLVAVESMRGDVGVIRVGDRHRFITDPDPVDDALRLTL